MLDLACHDGRFTFAALQAGAKRVVGIDVDRLLIDAAYDNMAEYGVARDRVEFVQRDMFRHFDDLDQFDVVFCFGILYHITDHMQLFTRIAGVDPRWLLIDTKVSQLDGAVVELRTPIGVTPPPPGSAFEGYPTRSALDVMLTSFGWEVDYFDWEASGLLDAPGLHDYREGRRVSVVVRCGEPVDPEVRERAVWLVKVLEKERKHQWMTIRGIAQECGVSPYALRTWVLEAEGAPAAPRPDRDG